MIVEFVYLDALTQQYHPEEREKAIEYPM